LKKDIIRLTDGYDIQDAINSATVIGIEDTAFFVRSNKKRINTMNSRTKILDKESELSGDFGS
jgi:hypothetical protein